jgi:hypothetical protein
VTTARRRSSSWRGPGGRKGAAEVRVWTRRKTAALRSPPVIPPAHRLFRSIGAWSAYFRGWIERLRPRTLRLDFRESNILLHRDLGQVEIFGDLADRAVTVPAKTKDLGLELRPELVARVVLLSHARHDEHPPGAEPLVADVRQNGSCPASSDMANADICAWWH